MQNSKSQNLRALSLSFSVTMLISACLMFWLQPMVSKILLPKLGGAPSVWNTCMVFFQVSLLGGYCYAHLITKINSFKLQSFLHLCLLSVALLTLSSVAQPISAPASNTDPVFWLLQTLAFQIGLPFFVISATAPLLQKWFAHTVHPHAGDPYFLYGMSNFGSVFALVSYPVLIEPHVGLHAQSHWWQYTFISFSILIILSIVICGRFISHRQANYSLSTYTNMTWRIRLRVLILAFIPSSLLLSVTTHITTDVAAVPLLWLIPLALYMLSFIITFSKQPIVSLDQIIKWLPFALVPVVFTLPISPVSISAWLVMSVHLIGFFIFCLYCTSSLMASRPSTEHLTSFYLWMSIGGCMGGIFSAIIAPSIFNGVIEYPIALILMCATLSRKGELNRIKYIDVVLPIALIIGLYLLNMHFSHSANPFGYKVVLAYCIATAVVLSFSERPMLFTMGLAAVFLGKYTIQTDANDQLLYQHRNFFGVFRVLHDKRNNINLFFSGATLHGAAYVDNQDKTVGQTYYMPLVTVFNELHRQHQQLSIGIAGLGAGTLACFAGTHDKQTIFEINPIVISLARQEKYFNYLPRCLQNGVVIAGDARLNIEKEKDKSYDLLILDAFSSDSIPMHLVTKEAFQLYLRKLKKSGLILVNITNRFLNLEPVIAGFVKALKLQALVKYDIRLNWVDFN